MKAIGVLADRPTDAVSCLADIDLPDPVPGPLDVVVEVHAVSVNPIDLKMRRAKPRPDGAPRVLGWDAAGIVQAVGADVRGFEMGQRVAYAGALMRAGCNSERHAVDARLVGHIPDALSFADAAALPLTTLTAWESLFDRLGLDPGGRDAGKTLLVIGGAGGVGSMTIQLARHIAGLRVVATASRDASRDWCLALGAEAVVDHRQALEPALKALGLTTVDAIVCLSEPDPYFAAMAALIAPHGRIVCAVEAAGALPMNLLRAKSASFCWEGMFTRSMYATADMIEQGRIVHRVAAWVSSGRLRSPRTHTLTPLNAASLREAHHRLAQGTHVGKLVITR